MSWKLIPYREAMEIALKNTPALTETDEVPLEEAGGRVGSEDILSPLDVPPFPRSAMDGYAVRAEDTLNPPVLLTLKDTLEAGEVSSSRVEKGECIGVATGAPLPPGADAVVMVENTRKDEGGVRIFKKVRKGENVIPRGEDILKGEKILQKGDILTPQIIGALAGVGKEKVRVYRKPRVRISLTGGEFIPPGKPLPPGKVYDINSFTLRYIVRDNGGIPFVTPPLPDDPEVIKKSILEDEKNFDLLVMVGGSSVGEKDFVPRVVKEIGEVFFHGVSIKPGKPVLLGKVNNTLVLGIPGYPASCFCVGYLFLKPILRKMAHLKEDTRKEEGILAEEVSSPRGKLQFLTLRKEKELVYPVFKKSADITSVSRATGFLTIPPETTLLKKGERVEFYLF